MLTMIKVMTKETTSLTNLSSNVILNTGKPFYLRITSLTTRRTENEKDFCIWKFKHGYGY